jgi:DNA repair exonuclease SbcCD ATPase subunit
MVTGRDNLNLINQHLFQAQTQQEEASRRLEDLHRQLDANRMEMSNGYRGLARLRLDDLQAGEVIAHLNETDQMLFTLVQNLKRTRLNLKEQLEASLARQRQLEGQRQELERQRDEAGEARQRQLEQTHKRISETEAYRQQQERAQKAVTVVKNAEDKASRAEKDRLEKGKPYEADRLFMYLWNKRFLTPDYRGGWFTRQLDNWVAKIIDFQRNRSNYYMLLELPRRLREHATKVQQTAQLEMQALQTMERQAAEADGILALQSKVQEAEKQLKKLDADIEAEEKRHQQLLAEEAEFNAGTDPLSKQIIDLQSAALAKEPLPSLYQKARATSRTEDDVIVAKIHQLQQQQDQIGEEIKSVNTILQQQQRNMGELEEVRRRYRQGGYDAYNSRFPGDFTLGVLLGRMLEGLANPDTVWGEINRHHQTSGPAGGMGGDFGGSGEISGGFGGGGGDFYTDDSF